MSDDDLFPLLQFDLDTAATLARRQVVAVALEEDSSEWSEWSTVVVSPGDGQVDEVVFLVSGCNTTAKPTSLSSTTSS